MTVFRVRASGKIVTERDLRALNPNSSMPEVLTAIAVDAVGADPVAETPMPHVGLQQSAERTLQQVDGQWTYVWTLRDWTPQEVAQHTADHAVSIQDEIVQRTQQRLDEFAATRGYDDVNSIGKYQNISDAEIAALPEEERAQVTQFRAECRYLAVATARTWAKLYRELAKVQTGTRPMPAGYEDIETELPVLQWPA